VKAVQIVSLPPDILDPAYLLLGYMGVQVHQAGEVKLATLRLVNRTRSGASSKLAGVEGYIQPHRQGKRCPPKNRPPDPLFSDVLEALLNGTWVCNFCYKRRFSNGRKSMKRILLAAMIAALALGPAMAQDMCASKAVDKNGKPLAGAALNSFLKKCKREACEPKAVSAEGKKLSGAAKNSFMKKCERDA
jgi:hypothetical protein